MINFNNETNQFGSISRKKLTRVLLKSWKGFPMKLYNEDPDFYFYVLKVSI